jgi:hypothetical protein
MAQKNTIMEVVNLARSIMVSHCRRLGIPFRGEGLVSLTSGLDVALTLMEESVGTFRGLSEESARTIINYFEDESSKAEPVSIEIALWYSAWAQAIDSLFIDTKHPKHIE